MKAQFQVGRAGGLDDIDDNQDIGLEEQQVAHIAVQTDLAGIGLGGIAGDMIKGGG